jgi:hypothetical protein
LDRLLDDISHAYDSRVAAPGKELHFAVLLAFLASFGFIRTSAHMIRAQVSWWPGNVETKGGTHIHHMVWGILLLMGSGYVGVAVQPEGPWSGVVAALFGIGLGLTLDEFALWLNLEDVYWQEKGRQSIDAVIVAATLLTVTLLGLQFFIDVLQAGLVSLGVGGQNLAATESTLLLGATQAVGIALGVVSLLKGKRFAGVVGIFVPVVALVGAIRLAKPTSWWARRYYEGAKLQRSADRFAGDPDGGLTPTPAAGSSAG